MRTRYRGGPRRGLAVPILGMAALLGVPVAQGATRVLSLNEAIRRALEIHPSLVVSRANARAQEARIGSARAGYWPGVGYSLAYTRRTSNCVDQPASFPCTLSPTTPPWYETFNYFTAGVSINQPLYDFGRTSNAVEAAVVGWQAARDQVIATRQSLILEVKVAFFGVLSQQELVRVAKDTLAQQRKHLEQARGFYEAGTRTRIDVAQSEADTATAELNLIKARINLENAKLNLLGAMGETMRGTDFTVRSETPMALPEENAPVAELLGRAVADRADLRALEAAARQAEANIRIAESGFWPQISLQIGPTWAGTEIQRLSGNLVATINLTAPFGGSWNPYATYHQVKELRALAVASRATAAKLLKDLRLEIEGAKLTLQAAQKAITAADRALVAAQERYTLAEGRYQTGAGSIIELSDAQAALTAARAARIQTDFDIAVARARLLKALGRE
jgi:outer membrane protein